VQHRPNISALYEVQFLHFGTLGTTGLICERAVIIVAHFRQQHLPALHSIKFLSRHTGLAAMLNAEGLPMFKELVDGKQT